MELIKIREHRELMKQASEWFHTKWEVPAEAYAESMEACLDGKGSVPDLRPNVCALYVEEAYRCRGIAGKLLDHACEDMAEFGIDTLYLVTDHTSFYEKYGWDFLCMVEEAESQNSIRMYVHKR